LTSYNYYTVAYVDLFYPGLAIYINVLKINYDVFIPYWTGLSFTFLFLPYSMLKVSNDIFNNGYDYGLNLTT